MSLTVHDPTWTTMGKTSLPEDSTRQSWQLGRFANTDMGAEFGQHSYRLTGTIPLDRLGPTEENWDEIHDIYFDARLRGSARPGPSASTSTRPVR